MAKQREDRFAELEDRFAGYTVCYANREKIGKWTTYSWTRTITPSTSG